MHVLYPPMRPGAAVHANWLGMFGRVVIAGPVVLGGAAYCVAIAVG